MLTMTKDEARAIMKTQGWYYKEFSPRGKAKYISAKRRQGSRVIDRYICPLSRLNKLTEAELVAKLAPAPEPTEETSSKENHEPEVPDTPNSP
jgi:hypothetical protein